MADQTSGYSGPDRRTSGAEISLLSLKFDVMHNDVAEIKGAMRELTSAITKLALIEERITVTSSAQQRAFDAIKAVEVRVSALEQKAPINDKTTVWIDRGITALVGAFLMFLFDKIKG